jgi:hypothetical protein
MCGWSCRVDYSPKGVIRHAGLQKTADYGFA